MSDRSDPRTAAQPGDADAPADQPTPEPEAEVEKRDPSGGPTTLGWWLDDGPDSPIAADIKEPERHL
jgi:hypothetical protein